MRFLIVDDDFGSRGGMALALSARYPGCSVTECRTLEAAQTALTQAPETDLVLLDLRLDDSDGIDTLRAMKSWCEEHDCDSRIVVVSGALDPAGTLVLQAIDDCATGFIVKGCSEQVFCSAIDLTLAGSIYVPEQYLLACRTVRASVDRKLDVDLLTSRERQVAALLVQGLTYKQIARRLGATDMPMSDHTVRAHVQRIAWKLRSVTGATDRSGFSAKAAVILAVAAQRLHLQA